MYILTYLKTAVKGILFIASMDKVLAKILSIMYNDAIL